MLYKEQFDFLALSETWLNDKIRNKSLLINNYKLLRYDRANSRGGGLILYFRSTLKIRKLSSGVFGKVEFLCCELIGNFGKILIIVIYNPPPSAISDITNLETIFSQYIPDYEKVICLGDFNFNMLKSNPLNSCLNILNLHYLPLKPTRLNNLLDLIILFEPDKHNIVSFGQREVPEVSDHQLIFACYKFSRPRDKIYYTTASNYKQIDYEYFTNSFFSIDWKNLQNFNDVNDILQEFNSNVMFLDNLCVPQKLIIQNCPTAPWLNSHILKLMEQRDLFYNKYKRYGLDSYLKSFKYFRNKTNLVINQTKENYYFGNIHNSKLTWKNLKLLGVSNATCDVKITLSADDIMAGIGCFASSLGVLPLPNTEFEANNIDSFVFDCVDEFMVLNAIRAIKSNAKGYDMIDFKLLKLFVDLFLPHITFLINQCLSKSVFPNSWKVASITPIPKKDFISSIDDIRPISILPALSKVLEKIMQLQIQEHLRKRDFLCKYQSGYKTNHSTTTALIHIVDDLSAMLDIKNSSAVLVLLDFSKAFDRINHTLLLQKMSLYYQFSNSAITLLHSYLNNRKQFVKCENNISNISDVVAGVPQGSILGPLLFSIYINDLTWRIEHCRFHLYADDLQLYIGNHLTNLNDIVSKLNKDLQNISLWAKNNSLLINPIKSKALLLSRNKSHTIEPKIFLDNNSICFVPVVNNLGLLLNSRLNWDDHINFLCQRVNYSLYTLRLIKKFCPIKLRIYLIKSLVLPLFTYCDVIFNKCDSSSKRLLEVTFNNCTRYVYDLRKFDHISAFRNAILGCDLFQFYYYRTAVFIFRLINCMSPLYLHEKINFSQSLRTKNINLPVNKTNIYNHSGFVNTIIVWNGLPAELKTISSLILFKKLLFKLILDDKINYFV